MIETYGMSHVALAVRDPRRSFEFYRRLFGAVVVYADDQSIQAQTPGSRDVLVFERNAARAGKLGGVQHFGFRLVQPKGFGRVLRSIRAAGGVIRESGEFAPGLPYVFFFDLDGHEVEVWYEQPTPVDPPVTARARSRPDRKRPQ